MQPDELALSEVHLTKQSKKCERQNQLGYAVCISDFEFKFLNKFKKSYTDEDGDIVVTRQTDITLLEGIIYIEHSLETKIKDVGLQVWSGCILLCDYILCYQENFHGKQILELGCGIGLASILLSGVAQHVYATDIGEQILQNCYNNIQRNSAFPEKFGRCCNAESIVSVKELNWIEDALKKDGQFGWTEKHEHMLLQTEVIIAADVVYNNDLTDGLFFWLHKLFKNSSKPKCAYISVERRLNFTLDELEVTCPAYKYFMQCLEHLKKYPPDGQAITVEQINTEFSQAFHNFERSKYLELWNVTSIPM